MLPHHTPLIHAVQHGRADEVAALLAGGADANKPKTNGLLRKVEHAGAELSCGRGR